MLLTALIISAFVTLAQSDGCHSIRFTNNDAAPLETCWEVSKTENNVYYSEKWVCTEDADTGDWTVQLYGYDEEDCGGDGIAGGDIYTCNCGGVDGTDDNGDECVDNINSCYCNGKTDCEVSAWYYTSDCDGDDSYTNGDIIVLEDCFAWNNNKYAQYECTDDGNDPRQVFYDDKACSMRDTPEPTATAEPTMSPTTPIPTMSPTTNEPTKAPVDEDCGNNIQTYYAGKCLTGGGSDDGGDAVALVTFVAYLFVGFCVALM